MHLTVEHSDSYFSGCNVSHNWFVVNSVHIKLMCVYIFTHILTSCRYYSFMFGCISSSPEGPPKVTAFTTLHALTTLEQLYVGVMV